jgi:hypothetical protein
MRDFTGIKESDIHRITGAKQLYKPTVEVSGYVFFIEWMQRDPFEVKEPSTITFEDLRKVAPRLLAKFFLSITKLVPRNKDK